jgi:hypothetical protein
VDRARACRPLTAHDPVTERGPPWRHGAALLFDRRKVTTMKSCNFCKLSKVCNDLPAVCLLVPYMAAAVVAVSMGYLFVTQELL